jgi:hypothetical protein
MDGPGCLCIRSSSHGHSHARVRGFPHEPVFFFLFFLHFYIGTCIEYNPLKGEAGKRVADFLESGLLLHDQKEKQKRNKGPQP